MTTLTQMIKHVSIKVSEGGHNLMEIEKFIEMSLTQRLQLLTEKRISFLDEDGNKVPLIEGVRYANELIKSRRK
ncbi:MAG: hypothetical protein CMB80_04915 [Flammeovirgaceae bacterium]|nr:hypothetical protein [Flammeovirgaceae bacterium]MBE63640.1 hypothetical protein [Flammeovirgaceae bacterium]MBR11018.1 hypothetical protein [Rickettsiales bacterium]HCX22556.1 hypothetical protein [Cytophagales bacterium]|tara:strand:+ start:313 stop:534 length:222 start_codon:yes stop_codon:yes gene_type:complete